MRLPVLLLSLPLAAAAAAQVPTGKQVIARCQRAYDSVRTLEGRVSASIGGQKGTAHIWFARPGRLRVTGKTIFNSDYDLIVDGASVWVLNSGSWSRAENAEMGIATVTGVSGNAATHVPALLLHTKWGSIGQFKDVATKAARDRIGGRDVYRLSMAGAMPMTIWVDAKTYFLVRTSTSVMNRTIRVEFEPPVVNRAIPASRFRRS